MSNPQHIAQKFVHATTVVDAQPYGSGNVNDTFLVILESVEPVVGAAHFVLQRINENVFPQPALILLNLRTFTDFIRQKLAQEPVGAPRRWETPQVLTTVGGDDFWVDEAGGFWRAISLIERAKTLPKIRDANHARESGFALGRFHSLVSDLDPARLHDTLPGFHITPQYLTSYDQVVAGRANASDAMDQEVAYGLDFVSRRRQLATVLEDAQARGELPLRTMHGDPKVDNILIDDETGQAVSLIDLDTVKPGLVHYDIGDCLRSCCNPAGEETTDLATVRFDLGLCHAILDGYLAEAARFFSRHDYAYLYSSIRVIGFELGLRFFTDYLAGNVYFKVRHPEHNLNRALVQFRLVEEIETNEAAIRDIIASLTPG